MEGGRGSATKERQTYSERPDSVDAQEINVVVTHDCGV